jgi:hypothetical protein
MKTLGLLLSLALAGPWPPHKRKLAPTDRDRIEEKCKKFGGESYNKCVELELSKIKDAKEKEPKK